MPEIELASPQPSAAKRFSAPLITPAVTKAIHETLAQGRQVIVFHNRRGYTPFHLCLSCGWVPQCRQCSVSLTYHKASDKMHCHYCGNKQPVIRRCGQCGDERMQARSFGTQKIEEEVQQLFPQARIARMDIDSMKGKHQHATVFRNLEAGKVDILIGTQMVVKGLDFSGVQLVVILQADGLLSFPDFRAQERAFQLMAQVSGRAGRADGKGKVIIQAYKHDHKVIQWVKDYDIRAMYQQEMALRKAFDYPPVCRLFRLHFKHKKESTARQAAEAAVAALANESHIKVLGPSPALVYQIRGYFIQEVLIKCQPDTILLSEVKAKLLGEKQKAAKVRGLQFVIDVDPV